MVHLFLSDVHLGAFKADKNRHLESELNKLVDYCQSQQIRIHILGDLFDYWMESPDFIPELGKLLLRRFKEYNRAMEHEATFVTGNHDYWTQSHFEDCGFMVEHEYLPLKIGNRQALLCHGDGLSNPKFQLPRPLLHRFLRNERFITLYKTIFGGKTGLRLMKWFSSATRDEEFKDTGRLDNWAEFMLNKFQYDVIITGHDHIPRVETFSGGTYINTGAFHKYKTVLIYTNGAFKLVTWNNGANEFKPFSISE